jgi:hypothetical protein
MARASRAFLRTVADGSQSYATNITYHANRMWNGISYGSGLISTQTVASHNMPRPASIGLSSGWSTGTFAYDGMGNITRIGTNYYLYDGTGRLTEGTAEWSSSSAHKLQRSHPGSLPTSASHSLLATCVLPH